ncbi:MULTISPECIES: ABC transporter permease [Streptomyces]|uniref:Peptide ABC transporter permease n=1 Tax=Streptomyces gougerotii TaxID=53448 RepID=A0A8H9LN56_9ACTN|nr:MULTISPECIES: ABC transporter permease [Streptomyces]NEE36436.1 ABC transporter permease [Streptomyces sp. SID7982]MDQ0297442.1 peptide/nickel transport system permease protein [Streptomyces sp. DSM 41037]WPR49802.1 ABC transporter permease [Streptomyces sp. S399]WSU39278.1 ABC transporter permease [Streptomyces gougerotii]GFH81467.1 peptide ABC transporter permease [Streptomyces gougerotii]
MGPALRRLALRALELLVVLFIASIGVFSLVVLMPGDPAVDILGAGRAPSEYAALRTELGLDQPLATRYFDWLGGALTGDLGRSVVPPRSDVAGRVMSALPVSLEIAVLGLLIALLVAVPLAMWSAYREGSAADRIIGAGTFGVLSVPSFLAGLLLILLLVDSGGWFPRSAWVRIGDGDLLGNLHHAFLPALTVALAELAMFTRVLRGDLIVTLREDYILAARAKGMNPLRILFTDALRPSSFSLVTLLGLSLGRLIGATVVVEYLFSLPGMGTLIVNAANQGDYPMVQGAVLTVAVIYVVINAGIDLSYGYLDPRTRRVHA